MTSTSLWQDPHPLVLASGSATRRDMLAAAGLPLIIDPARIDERRVETTLPASTTPESLAAALASAKARDVASRHPGHLVLGADQTLEWRGRVIHKPADLESARRQLAAMAGDQHHLHSAYALVRDGRLVSTGCVTATLTMRGLSDLALDSYMAAAGNVILSSVGAYQLESLGVHLFTAIIGDHFTILGLPLLNLLRALRSEGALA